MSIVPVNVYFLPALVTSEQLAGKTVVVIDVLRATTTITQALASGATEIIPCLEVSEARRKGARCRKPRLLGGERAGVKIAGFDLGNSPAEYTPKAVKGKSIFFTTTNGTRALLLCGQARRVLLGAFTNRTALCRTLAQEQEVALLCAGTDGQITSEDVLLAGAIAREMTRSPIAEIHLNDAAQIARLAWLACEARGDALENLLGDSQGGRNLLEIGHARDIGLAAQLDQHRLVGEFVPDQERIVVCRKNDAN